METILQYSTENKSANLDRLSALLGRLPAEERAVVWEGIARNLAERLQEQR